MLHATRALIPPPRYAVSDRSSQTEFDQQRIEDPRLPESARPQQARVTSAPQGRIQSATEQHDRASSVAHSFPPDENGCHTLAGVSANSGQRNSPGKRRNARPAHYNTANIPPGSFSTATDVICRKTSSANTHARPFCHRGRPSRKTASASTA